MLHDFHRENSPHIQFALTLILFYLASFQPDNPTSPEPIRPSLNEPTMNILHKSCDHLYVKLRTKGFHPHSTLDSSEIRCADFGKNISALFVKLIARLKI